MKNTSLCAKCKNCALLGINKGKPQTPFNVTQGSGQPVPWVPVHNQSYCGITLAMHFDVTACEMFEEKEETK